MILTQPIQGYYVPFQFGQSQSLVELDINGVVGSHLHSVRNTGEPHPLTPPTFTYWFSWMFLPLIRRVQAMVSNSTLSTDSVRIVRTLLALLEPVADSSLTFLGEIKQEKSPQQASKAITHAATTNDVYLLVQDIELNRETQILGFKLLSRTWIGLKIK